MLVLGGYSSKFAGPRFWQKKDRRATFTTDMPYRVCVCVVERSYGCLVVFLLSLAKPVRTQSVLFAFACIAFLYPMRATSGREARGAEGERERESAGERERERPFKNR